MCACVRWLRLFLFLLLLHAFCLLSLFPFLNFSLFSPLNFTFSSHNLTFLTLFFLFLPFISRFDSVSDLLEPVSDGLKNHCFISKSYDATSHFETAANDVLSLYERITGDYIAWVIHMTTISNASNYIFIISYTLRFFNEFFF